MGIDLKSEMKGFISDNELFSEETSLLVAVSGGVDSMVLLHLLHSCGYTIGVAHVDHGTREGGSTRDRSFVEEQATTLGMPFYTEYFKETDFSGKRGSFQENAREVRYAALGRIADRENFDVIVTAHHLDDRIETFFLDLLRGTGFRGLTGMPMVNQKVVRPLLFASKERIKEYAIQQKIPWVEDETNQRNAYRRNAVRNKLLPVLREIEPSYHKILQKDFDHFDQIRRVLERDLEKAREDLLRKVGEEFRISIPKLKDYPEPSFILFELLYPFGFREGQVKDVMTALPGTSGKRFYSNDHLLIKDREDLILTPCKKEEMKEETLVHEMDATIRYPLSLRFQLKSFTEVHLRPEERSFEFFDPNKVELPLKIRPWRSGDKFQPIGMKGEKLVSDLLTDLKLPVHQKERTYVLVDAEGRILWVVGHRMDERFKVENGADKVLKVSVLY